MVERFNRTVEKAIRTAHVEGKDWRKELDIFLLNYRATPHAITGTSPAKIMFGRDVWFVTRRNTSLLFSTRVHCPIIILMYEDYCLDMEETRFCFEISNSPSTIIWRPAPNLTCSSVARASNW